MDGEISQEMQREMARSQLNWHHDFIATNGVKLHYVAAGSGPLMLLLHGFPECWYSWRYQLMEFAQDYRVVALDLRGYNDSEKPNDLSAYRFSTLVEDIKGVIQGLGYDQCILAGHDWGGAIAWQFAYTYPQFLEKLIILNIPHPAKFAEGLRNPQQLLRSWYILFFQLPFVPEWILQFNGYEAIAKAFSAMAVHPSAFSEADLKVYQNAAAKPGALTAMLNYYRSNFNPDLLLRHWPVLQVPTLMIWGENDVALGKELTYGTEAYVENFQIHYIPNCSHWVQQEQPLEVNRLIQDFLAPTPASFTDQF